MRNAALQVWPRLRGPGACGSLAAGRGRCGFELARCMRTAAEAGEKKAPWENYDPQAFSDYYWYRPFHVLHRAVAIVAEMAMLSFWQVAEKDIRRRAAKLRQSLIRLGPFYIKLGQALSTRPDVMPNAYCQELAKLQDRIPPFPTPQALRFMREQLGAAPSELFAKISEEPVAAASLGQVYKARLHTGELVAVKVQRPGMLVRLALDAHLLRLVGGRWQRFTGGRDIVPVVDELVGRMFEEVDYIREGQNAERFARLYGVDDPDYHNKANRRRRSASTGRRKEGSVKVPKVYWNFTTKSVLTMEWIEGIKLTDREKLSQLHLNAQDLVDQGVLCSLKQLLEEGFFHADPHPGNLVVTKEGVLAYFDFGMMSEMRREYRVGLIRTLVHYVNRDSLGLANDFIVLGFLPLGSDIEPVARALQLSLGEEGSTANSDFQGIMSRLSDVMHQFNFRLPAEYAMVIRALGSLEGTATTLDPEFKVVSRAYPFIVGRLLADPDPEMREILRELLIRQDGKIRWRRLERLVIAIAEEAAEATASESVLDGEDTPSRKRVAGIRGSFDTRAVASATKDVLEYIFSPKGMKVRIYLAQDILQAFDMLLASLLESYLQLEQTLGGKVWPSDGSEEYVVSASSSTDSGTTDTDNARKNEDWRKIFAPAADRFWELSYWKTFWYTKIWGEPVVPDVKAYQVRSQPGDTPKFKGRVASAHSAKEFEARIRKGLSAFGAAVEQAPETWGPLLLGVAAKPEARAFLSALIAALFDTYCSRTSEATWLFLSKKLHDHYG